MNGSETTALIPEDRMPEAEVALRLAFYLLAYPGSSEVADVAIDGAQVKVGERVVFSVEEFLRVEGFQQVERQRPEDWRGSYVRGSHRLNIHSRSGVGDVVGRVGLSQVRAECKKGPLIRKKGSPEYPLLHEVLGQLLTVQHVEEGDILVAAVPYTDRFRRLASEWQSRPLVARSGIRIVLVGRSGIVEGLSL